MGGRGYEFGVKSKGLDLNVFNGTLEELKAWAIPEPATPPEICPTCGQEIPEGQSLNLGGPTSPARII
jgi:hypothetical protein